MYDNPVDFPPPAPPTQPMPSAPPGPWAQPGPWVQPGPWTQPGPWSVSPPVPQPGPWPVPAPRQARRVGVGVVVAVALLAALVGAGGGLAAGLAIRSGHGATAGAGAATGAPVAPPPSPAAVPAGDGTALLAKVLPVPAGARPLTVKGSTNGVMNLDQFMQREFPDDQSERGRLQARGFLVVAQREWIGTDGVEVHIQVIQFESPDGAESEVLEQSHAYSGDPDVTDHFALPAPHGNGYEKSALDDAGNRRMILMAQDGPLAVYIFLYTPKSFDRPGATSLMQRQLAALA